VKAAAAALLLGALTAGPAAAQSMADLFSPDTFHGIADIRLTAADGEKSWLDGGFGKTYANGGRVQPRLAEASLAWRPRLNFAVSGYVTVQAQPDVSPAVDIGEAFVQLRAPPTEAGRFSGRVGIFYPPVSQEHDGVAWTVPDMLSASAINTWIGEEVKVAGVEGTWRRRFGDHEVAATAAVFGWNDTSGTLLSFRGWALDGVKAGVNTRFPLPPLSPFMQVRQANQTDPYYELDGRAGYYGRLEWRPPAPVTFNATYYDNAGNRIAVQAQQWAWETRFLNLGMKWQPADGVTVTAQAMNGETLMGFRFNNRLWLDMGFRSAFLLVQKAEGERDMFSGRIDLFHTHDRTLVNLDNNNETGWAATAAWRHKLSDHVSLILEAQHVDSRRPARLLAGDNASRDQNVLQAGLRLGF
jgi:hypothetical protein